ncbi:MAG: VCBS repeat-containing protein [bacterium]
MNIRSAIAVFSVAIAFSGVFADPPALPSDSTNGMATFNPASPTTCDMLETTYNATGSIITISDTQVFLHISFNNFITTNVFSMANAGGLVWKFTNDIPDTATNAVAFFEGISNNADSSDGFAVPVLSCSTGVSPATFSPTPVTACSGMLAIYNPANTAFSNSTLMRLLISYNTDSTVWMGNMTFTSGVWMIAVDIPDGPASAIMAFDDGTTTNLDTNGGNFYTVAISTCRAGGATSGFFAVRGDLDGDGLGDLVLKDENSETYFLMFMDGYLDAIDGADFLGEPTDISPFHLVASSDLDGDGFEDLVFEQGDSGLHVAAFMQYGEVVNAAFIFSGGESNIAPWHVVAGGDFDADGFGELVLQDDDSGIYAIAFMDGADIFISEFLFGGEALDVSPWRVAAGGDLDGDGNADLVFKYGKADIYAIGFMDGSFMVNSAYFMDAETDISPWKLVASSDLDGDGFSELIFKFGNGDLYDVTFMDAQNILLSDYLFGGTDLASWEVVGGK